MIGINPPRGHLCDPDRINECRLSADPNKVLCGDSIVHDETRRATMGLDGMFFVRLAS